MRHPLLVEGRPNCARQSLASTLSAPRVAATWYCDPGRHANVITPCSLTPCLNVPYFSGKKKQHTSKHKLFGPDLPRTFLTLTPGRPWVKKFLPITGAAEKRTFWCGRPTIFGADVHDPKGFSKKFVQKKFALIFWPLILESRMWL